MTTVHTVTMADAIGASANNLPTSLAKVGGYDTGSPPVPWSTAQWNRFIKSGHVHINQDPGSDPLIGDVLDSEAGAWSIPGAVEALKKRKAAGKSLNVYISIASLTGLANALVAAQLAPVGIWLANWNLTESQAAALVVSQSGPFPIKAVQWASPSSNPATILPGSGMTLKQANADLSVADASWFPAPVGTPPPPPPVTVSAVLVRGLVSRIVHSTDGIHWQ